MRNKNSIVEILIQELGDFPPMDFHSKTAFKRIIKCMGLLAKRIDSIEKTQKRVLKNSKTKSGDK